MCVLLLSRALAFSLMYHIRSVALHIKFNHPTDYLAENPSHDEIQHVWVHLVVESGTVQHQGTCLYHGDDQRRNSRVRDRRHTSATDLLSTNIIIWIPTASRSRRSGLWILIGRDPSPICRVATEHDLAQGNC